MPSPPIMPFAPPMLIQNKAQAIGALIGYTAGIVFVVAYVLYRRVRYGKWCWKDPQWP